MKRLLLAPVFLFALAACGGSETDHRAVETSNIEAPDGGTATSSSTIDLWEVYDAVLDAIWDVVCDQWEVIEQTGVYVFCENYLDAQGIPSSGIRRIIARRICHRKVNEAIDEAMCSISDYFEDEVVEDEEVQSEEEDAGVDDGASEDPMSEGEPDGGV